MSATNVDHADVVIVGVGAAGAVLAAKLARAGLSVVALEAGPHRDSDDFASDELSMLYELFWLDERISTGRDPIELGWPNSGRGVGGGTVHFVGYALRFHEDDFRTKTIDGVGEDWPITYQDLEPYYAEVERFNQVSGPAFFPWGPHQGPFPKRSHEAACMHDTFRRGCERIGARSTAGPMFIISSPTKDRKPCTYRGFCKFGCKPKAKSSTLVTYVPEALRHGATILPNAMVTRVNTSKTGRVESVTYLHNGRELEQKGDTFILSAYSVENVRLLLNSTSTSFPNGLANSSGAVGKFLMVHSADFVIGKYETTIRQYRGPQGLALTQEWYSRKPDDGFVRAYTLETETLQPIEFSKALIRGKGLWGERLVDEMRDYNHYASFGIVGECLPSEDNTVTLSDEPDEFGIARALVTYSYLDNDKKIIEHSVGKCEEIHAAAGAVETFQYPGSAHLLGTCRMGGDPRTSVVDKWCRTHDVKNLYICDGSVFTTGAGVNPTLTIEALAARTADHVVETKKRREL